MKPAANSLQVLFTAILFAAAAQYPKCPPPCRLESPQTGQCRAQPAQRTLSVTFLCAGLQKQAVRSAFRNRLGPPTLSWKAAWGGYAPMENVEKTTIRKVMWRLMPFLFVCYFVAYLDRVNVGFAALQMNAALGLSEAAFGLGAGLFFISYFLLEVPSNLALDRFGARLWIARIMFSWGLVSGMFAFIGPISAATGLSNEWV